MQTIKTIIGLHHEGKTTEILEDFLKHLGKEELCKSVKPVFITSDESYVALKGFAVNKLNIDTDFKENVYEINDLAKNKNEDIEKLLVAIILSNLDKSDCVFYIDGLGDNIKDFHMKLLFLSNSFPNQITPHSFDVVYTVNRLPVGLDRESLESVKK